MIRISELSLTYRDGDHALLALDKLNLQLEAGKVTALIGESGSGKTSLANCLLGLLPDNAALSGNIDFQGIPLERLSEQQWREQRWSELAMLFQNGANRLNPVQKLIDQVAEPLRQKSSLSNQAARLQARKALQQLGLESDQTERYPHQLSGGQIQRAMLAMALILDPKVVILDEPTAALDVISKQLILATIDQLRRQGKAILLISHDLEVVARTADQIAVLYLGQIMETLPKGDLFTRPEHPYTLALTKSFPHINAVRDLGGLRGDAFYRVVHAHAAGNHDHSHTIAPDSRHDEGHAPPSGCLFEPRCTQAIPDCRQRPVIMQRSGEHTLRCLRGGIAPRLRLAAVTKAYGKVQVIRQQDLDINCGEVFCLVGETGSGKTTLALIAAGALQPDSGQRTFFGPAVDPEQTVSQLSSSGEIGIVYQDPAAAVSPRMKVFDIVAEPLRIQQRNLSVLQIQQRVAAILCDVHLPDRPEFLNRYPHELNLGTLQRICIARALISEPCLLVADEPTSALDASAQAKVMKLLLHLQIEKGLTLLLVSHDLGLARKVADRVAIMQSGSIVEIGAPQQLFANPRHPYSQKLLNSTGAY